MRHPRRADAGAEDEAISRAAYDAGQRRSGLAEKASPNPPDQKPTQGDTNMTSRAEFWGIQGTEAFLVPNTDRELFDILDRGGPAGVPVAAVKLGMEGWHFYDGDSSAGFSPGAATATDRPSSRSRRNGRALRLRVGRS
jgi:hypothetical protein